MKKKSLYIAALLLGLLGFNSCDNDWETPPSVIPSVPEGIVPNTSIEEFKAEYWSTSTNSASLVEANADGSHKIIEGRIVSSDKSGNIYKNLIIQSNDGYAMTIGLNATETYKKYQQGQRIVIDATGMYAGMYNNLFQLGGLGEYNGAPSMTFAKEADFEAHAWVDGLAEPAKIDTMVVTIAELNQFKGSTELKQQWQSRIVRIDNVTWQDAGFLTFAEGNSVESATNRYVKDENGNSLLVRNSAHADFWNTILPIGTGSVTGILSFYGSDWQLLLIDKESCQGFTWVNPDETPEVTLVPNTTIKEFKETYWSTERNSATLVGQNQDGEDIVIQGVIISSDKTGNIYKNLIIRDESGEALTIAIDAKNLYLRYPMGQKVVIKVTGLYAGMYNNLFQLGGLGSYNGAPSMTFASAGVFQLNCQLDGKPDMSLAQPVTTTIATINAATSVEDMQLWMSQYVKFENVSWQDGGVKNYCDGSANTNRYIQDASGKTLLVRNNGYATFASQLLPAGTGSVSGILSRYGNDWQLMLIDTDSCQDFK